MIYFFLMEEHQMKEHQKHLVRHMQHSEANRKTQNNNYVIPSGDRTQDLWIRSPTRYPLR